MSKNITLGILYSGQLETQLVKSAKKIGGIKTIILTDDKNGPAQHFCDKFIYGNLEEKVDIFKLDNLLNELQEKKNFVNILKNTSEGQGVHVFIGSNTEIFNLSGCSMIVAPLKQRSKIDKINTLGAIGVIGPSRLNYARIIPMVDFTAKVLNKF